MIDPRSVPPTEVMTVVLYHCGCRMRVVSSPVEEGMRTRYVRCDVCGATSKTIAPYPPIGPAAKIANEDRRH